MIKRLSHSHRYGVTDLGRRSALFFARTDDRLRRLGISAVLPGTKPSPSPLLRAFAALDRQFGNVSLKTISPRTLDAITCKVVTQADLGTLGEYIESHKGSNRNELLYDQAPR